jgi:hypothetical protein
MRLVSADRSRGSIWALPNRGAAVSGRGWKVGQGRVFGAMVYAGCFISSPSSSWVSASRHLKLRSPARPGLCGRAGSARHLSPSGSARTKGAFVCGRWVVSVLIKSLRARTPTGGAQHSSRCCHPEDTARRPIGPSGGGWRPACRQGLLPHHGG